MTESWIPVGHVRSAHARAREVRVVVRKGYAHVFKDLAWIHFEGTACGAMRCKVAALRGDDSVAVVVLAPGLPRDAVGGLRGARVVVAPGELPPRPTRGWCLDDLPGLTVVMPGGETLGTVAEVYEGPANSAFSVARPDGSRCLLPAIAAVLQVVDLERGTLETGDVAPYIVEE